MSGVINKIKEAIVGEPPENPSISSVGAGTSGNDAYDTGSRTNDGRLNQSAGSEYSSTNRTGLGDASSLGTRGNADRSHEGLSSGVESSRLTNMGQIGQVGRESGSGVGTGFPGSTGHTGSVDKYGEGIDSSTSKPGVAGLEHHGQHHGGHHGEHHHGGLTGSTGRHERERELETGAIGSGFAGGEHARSGEYSGAGTGTGTGTTGGSHLTRADIESRIEPHRHENENFEAYASPSQFSHGKHHGVGQSGTAGEFGSNTTGTGVTGQGIGSGTGRTSGVGNEYSGTGRNDNYDNQTGSNVGSGTAPHNSNLLNKLDPRVDTNQTGRNL